MLSSGSRLFDAGSRTQPLARSLSISVSFPRKGYPSSPGERNRALFDSGTAGRGNRKDFLDLFFSLGSGGTVAGTLSLLGQRFHGVGFSTYRILKSLVSLEDAEEEPMQPMIKTVELDDVKKFLLSEVCRLS